MRLMTPMAGTGPERPQGLSDDELLDLVQHQTFRFFWDAAHSLSGLARHRTAGHGGPEAKAKAEAEVTAVQGTGFGVIAIVIAADRGWITRQAALDQLLKIVMFVLRADHYHGVLPLFLHGATGRAFPCSRKDDGADLVATAFFVAGLLVARQYFDDHEPKEVDLRSRINQIWREIEWAWHCPDGRDVLIRHWSPRHGWALDLEVRGWNECLLTYVLAAGSPSCPIPKDAYHQGWSMGRFFANGRDYHGIHLPLGPDFGGPLSWSQHTFTMLDPRGLVDRYANYEEQNLAHSLINRAHCIRNPKGHEGYGSHCWGLTSSDNQGGHACHQPSLDLGVISPSAAISSMPYAPGHALQALRHFYDDLGDRLWGEYGFFDAFNPKQCWVADAYVATNQGPIIAMIENYRTGLVWQLFMGCPEVKAALRCLEFDSPHLATAAS